jgi:hypothetical protein
LGWWAGVPVLGSGIFLAPWLRRYSFSGAATWRYRRFPYGCDRPKCSNEGAVGRGSRGPCGGGGRVKRHRVGVTAGRGAALKTGPTDGLSCRNLAAGGPPALRCATPWLSDGPSGHQLAPPGKGGRARVRASAGPGAGVGGRGCGRARAWPGCVRGRDSSGPRATAFRDRARCRPLKTGQTDGLSYRNLATVGLPALRISAVRNPMAK